MTWRSVGLLGFLRAAVVAANENARRDEDKEREREESSLRQTTLCRKLDAACAELMSLRAECAALKGKPPGAMG